MHKHYKLLIIAAILLLTLAVSLIDRTSIPTESAAASSPAQAAPDVTFTLQDGRTLKLNDLRGHTILLHFWASWCAPCREEFPRLLETIKKSDANTILLAVSGDAKKKDMQRFLAPYTHELSSPKVLIAQDPEHRLIEGVFQTFKYPETIVIAPDFTMQKKIIGAYKP